jgi:RNA polymerase sigma factor (sigma-70 family)
MDPTGNGKHSWTPPVATVDMMPRGTRACTDFTRPRAGRNLLPMDALPPPIHAEASDDALMLAWVGGDASAFEALYGRHRGRLHRFLVRQLRDPGLADEVFQDTWQRVVTAGRDWRPDAAFAAWLYRIARNRIADHWRAQQYRPPAPVDADERTLRVEDPDTPELRMDALQRDRGLQSALDALPAEQREAVLLRLEQELSLEEIGVITGVGRETVKSRLRYAMDKLRAALATPDVASTMTREHAP